MAYGLQVFDSSGNLTFDSTSRITRFIGTYQYASFNSSSPVSVAVPGLALDGTWAVVPNISAISLNINVGYVLVTYPFPNTTVPAGSFSVFRF